MSMLRPHRLSSVLRDWWNKLTKREVDETVEHERHREQDSAAERHFDDQSVDDIQADAVAEEHLGGFNPNELIENDKPPPDY